MMIRLTSIAYLGFLLMACDGSGVDPIQQSTGGTSSFGGNAGTTTQPGVGGGVNPQGGNPGTGGSSGSSPGTEPSTGSCPIVPSETGWVDGTNACKIQGAWYSYNDCEKSPTDCTTNHLPTVGSTEGFPNVAGKMCTSGTTAAINKQYDLKWGAGIGLNLNQTAGSDAKGGIGALPHALKGFSFTLSGTVALPTIRVNFPMASTEEAAHFKAIEQGYGNYKVLFTDATQGSWVTTPVALVNGDINAIQFQIVGDDEKTLPFDFCVENLTALY